MSTNDAPEPAPFTVQHITPETITEQQRDILAPIWNAELEEIATGVRGRIHKAVMEAKGDRATLEGARQMAKAHQAMLSEWNDLLGKRASPVLIDLQGSFGDLADDILASFNGELPEQQEGEGWKQ